MKVRTIALLLCDNDYSSFLRGLLEHVKLVLVHRHGDETWAEDHLSEMIWDLVEPCLLAYQVRSETYRSKKGLVEKAKYLQHMKEYIIKKMAIQFNEMAEASIEKLDHDGGSAYLEMETFTVRTF